MDSIRPTILFNPTNAATRWNNDHQQQVEARR